MAVDKQLVAPEYYIDGVLVPIVPNSYKATFAPGEIKTRAMGAGTAISLVRGVDLGTKIVKHTIEIPTTATNKQLVADLKQRSETGDYFVNKAVFPNSERTDDVLKYASLDNPIEAEYSAEGNMQLEFTGLHSGD